MLLMSGLVSARFSFREELIEAGLALLIADYLFVLCVAVPAAWDARGCQIMREAAIEAYVPAVCLLVIYESEFANETTVATKLIVNSSVQVLREIRIGEIACTSSRTFFFSESFHLFSLIQVDMLNKNNHYVLTFLANLKRLQCIART